MLGWWKAEVWCFKFLELVCLVCMPLCTISFSVVHLLLEVKEMLDGTFRMGENKDAGELQLVGRAPVVWLVSVASCQADAFAKVTKLTFDQIDGSLQQLQIANTWAKRHH